MIILFVGFDLQRENGMTSIKTKRVAAIFVTKE